MINDLALRELMDEEVIGTDEISLHEEFKGTFVYPKFKPMLSEADLLVKFPMYLFDWYAYC